MEMEGIKMTTEKSKLKPCIHGNIDSCTYCDENKINRLEKALAEKDKEIKFLKLARDSALECQQEIREENYKDIQFIHDDYRKIIAEKDMELKGLKIMLGDFEADCHDKCVKSLKLMDEITTLKKMFEENKCRLV